VSRDDDDDDECTPTKRDDINAAIVDIARLREKIEALEKSQGIRKQYEFGPETEAIRWAAVCLSRTLRPLTRGDEI
jgi:hypothetical protein